MRKLSGASCNDCYFRREGLCALAGEKPCPTFRRIRSGEMEPPQQPRLVPRFIGLGGR